MAPCCGGALYLGCKESDSQNETKLERGLVLQVKKDLRCYLCKKCQRDRVPEVANRRLEADH